MVCPPGRAAGGVILPGESRSTPSAGRRRLVPLPAVPAPASPAVPAATGAAAPAASPVLLGLGLVDGEAPAAHLLAAHRGDGGLRLGVAGHLHEPEPLGAARVAVA